MSAAPEHGIARPSTAILLERVVEFYRKAMHQSPEGSACLAELGLTDPSLAAAFRIGFASGTLLDAVPAIGDTIEGLKAAGILDEEGKERFRGCVVLPVSDRYGNVVQLYGYGTGPT